MVSCIQQVYQNLEKWYSTHVVKIFMFDMKNVILLPLVVTNKDKQAQV